MSDTWSVHQRPLRKPLYDSLVGLEARKQEFVAKPSKFSFMLFWKPFPPPMRVTSMNIPQNTPNAVSRLRDLLRVSVAIISSTESLSNFIFSGFWEFVSQP